MMLGYLQVAGAELESVIPTTTHHCFRAVDNIFLSFSFTIPVNIREDPENVGLFLLYKAQSCNLNCICKILIPGLAVRP
jgi:hypothetical protein